MEKWGSWKFKKEGGEYAIKCKNKPEYGFDPNITGALLSLTNGSPIGVPGNDRIWNDHSPGCDAIGEAETSDVDAVVAIAHLPETTAKVGDLEQVIKDHDSRIAHLEKTLGGEQK